MHRYGVPWALGRPPNTPIPGLTADTSMPIPLPPRTPPAIAVNPHRRSPSPHRHPRHTRRVPRPSWSPPGCRTQITLRGRRAPTTVGSRLLDLHERATNPTATLDCAPPHVGRLRNDAIWPQRQPTYRYTVKAFDTATPQRSGPSSQRQPRQQDPTDTRRRLPPRRRDDHFAITHQRAMDAAHGQRRRQGLLPLPQRNDPPIATIDCAATPWQRLRVGRRVTHADTTYSYTVKGVRYRHATNVSAASAAQS